MPKKNKSNQYYHIVMINGGLGSQMAKYAFYVLLTRKCTGKKILIDTYFYQYDHAWNGYELNRIFGITAPDMVELYDEQDSPINGYFEKAFDFLKKEQPDTEIIRVSRGEYTYYNSRLAEIKKLRDKILFKIRYEAAIRLGKETKQYGFYMDRYKRNCFDLNANVYFDEFNYTSDRYFREIKDKLKEVFVFSEFTDDNNNNCCRQMMETESVILHVRRSDHLYDNGFLYDNHYYSKAVNFIKKRVENPVFFIFSDEPQWCETNKDELGLKESDKIIFVNWNQQDESFRDMQLMTYGKHNILAISSFSWWGYYLSKRTDKIVCAPKGYWLEVENHF